MKKKKKKILGKERKMRGKLGKMCSYRKKTAHSDGKYNVNEEKKKTAKISFYARSSMEHAKAQFPHSMEPISHTVDVVEMCIFQVILHATCHDPRKSGQLCDIPGREHTQHIRESPDRAPRNGQLIERSSFSLCTRPYCTILPCIFTL